MLKRIRACGECRGFLRIGRHEIPKPVVYCSSGCVANAARRAEGLRPVPEWWGRELDRRETFPEHIA